MDNLFMNLVGSLFAALFAPQVALALVPPQPVIIVPTVLGTLPSEDGPVLDPIFHSYDNLLDTFIANGYEEGTSLFVLSYDWEQSATSSADELANLIVSAKAACGGCTAVDIVGHGLGGLIAWHHIQSPAYQSDVTNLIWLGTPFDGSPAAYFAADGGEFRLHASPVGRGLGQALLDAEAREGSFATTYEYVVAEAPAFGQLLPVSLNYLNGVTFPDDYPPNLFLQNLRSNDITTLVSAVSILGDNGETDTPQGIDVQTSTQPPRWPHGEPTAIFPDDGDGVVSRFSIESYFPPAYEFTAGHSELPTEAQSDIFAILTGETPVVTDEAYPVSCALFVSTSANTAFRVTDEDGDRVGSNFSGGSLTEIDGSFYSGSDSSPEYAIVVNPNEGVYDVVVEAEADGTFAVHTTLTCADGTLASDSEEGTLEDGEAAEIEMTVDEDGVVLETPPPSDTGAPVITITSPSEGATYLNDAIVFLTALAQDPEGSAINSTEYFFNDSPINPSNALPLSSAPLGAASVSVTATDVFGNVGSSTVNFTIEEPIVTPPVGSVGCLFALSPNAKDALKLAGSAKVNAIGCPVQVFSDADPAVNLAGSAKVESSKNCLEGTLKKTGSSAMTPAPLDCGDPADPFAAHAKPTVGSCTATNLSVSGSQNTILNPGVYCGGIKVSGSAKVTLNPGIYIIKNGPLSVVGSGQVNGTGISLFLTGTGTKLDIAGSGKVNLEAPSSGILSGFAIFLDKSTSGGTPAAASSLTGSGTLTVEGVVYLPGQTLEVAGSAKNTPTNLAVILAQTISLAGSAQLNLRINQSGTTVPVPAGL